MKKLLCMFVLSGLKVFHLDHLIPDELYLRLLYRRVFGKRLNLKNPIDFSEKLQWLKLYDRRPEYTTMVDKHAVKDYVANIIGKEFIIPTLGVWDKPAEIEWDALPDKFVLKCTHDSGGLVICRDKAKLNKKEAINKLCRSLKRDYFWEGREWPYKNVPHRIIAEKLMEANSGVKDLPDYKWYCFNGEPLFCQVIQNRTVNETIDFFDINWKHQDFIGLNPATHAAVLPPRPSDLDSQIKIAKRLSNGIPFSRIDLYSINNQTWFGEITLYPGSGTGMFTPDVYNKIMGSHIDLPKKAKL